jgi:lactate dehydrogenase-like 2-hydroxyacid dehydrogenase
MGDPPFARHGPCIFRQQTERIKGSRLRIYFCREGLAYIMNILQQKLPEDEVVACALEKVPEVALEADVLIPTVSRVGEEALRSPRLKLVQQFGAGLDSVDIAVATKHGGGPPYP